MKPLSDKKLHTGILIGAIILVLAALAFKTVIAFDPDEQYAFSMMYRFAGKERYLIDLFDAYQFSALFVCPLYAFAAFLQTQFGFNPVFSMRIFSALLSAVLNFRMYRFVRRKTGDRLAAVLSWLCILTALPKSILTLEHSNLALIGLSWLFIDLCEIRTARYPGLRLGIDCSLLSLVYPPLVLLYIPLVIILFRSAPRPALSSFLFASIVILVLVLFPVIVNTGISGAIRSIQMVLLDGSHVFSLTERLHVFLKDVLYLCKYLAVYLLLYGAAAAGKRIAKLKTITDEMILVSVPFLFAVIQFVFRPTSPMAGNGRYLLLMIWCAVLAKKDRSAPGLKTGIMIQLAACLLIYLTSNTNLVSASGYMMCSIIIYVLLKQPEMTQRKFPACFLFLVLFSQCISMIFTYRTYGTIEHHILQLDLKQDNQVLNGLWYRNDAVDFFQELSSRKDRFTSDALISSSIFNYSYAVAEKQPAAPVTAATLVYNEQWERYLEQCPFESIDVIIGKEDDDSVDSDDLLELMNMHYEKEAEQEFNTFTHYRFIRRQ